MPRYDVAIGDIVKWSNGRKPLGKVILKFEHRQMRYAIIEQDITWTLKIVRVYEKLEVVSASQGTPQD